MSLSKHLRYLESFIYSEFIYHQLFAFRLVVDVLAGPPLHPFAFIIILLFVLNLIRSKLLTSLFDCPRDRTVRIRIQNQKMEVTKLTEKRRSKRMWN